MKITTSIGRSDLVLFTLLVTPRLRATYVWFAVLIVFVFCTLLWFKGVPNSARGWLAIFAGTFGGAFGGYCVGGLISLAIGLIANPTANGALGQHEFEIAPRGLVYRSSSHEGITKWSAIKSVDRIGSFLCVRVADQVYFLVPRKSFDSEVQFLAFHEALVGASKNAA